MVLSVNAVKLDGTGTTLPVSQPLSFPAATSVTLNVIVKGQNGAAINLAGAAVVLTIWSSLGGVPKLLLSVQATIDNAAGGLCHFDLADVTTLALKGAHVYELTLLQGAPPTRSSPSRRCTPPTRSTRRRRRSPSRRRSSLSALVRRVLRVRLAQRAPQVRQG